MFPVIFNKNMYISTILIAFKVYLKAIQPFILKGQQRKMKIPIIVSEKIGLHFIFKISNIVPISQF